MTRKMNKVGEKLKINIISACSGKKIDSIIVNKDITINDWFYKFIRDKYYDELKESDIKIMIDFLLIYSYYDHSIGNSYYDLIGNGLYAVLFENNKDIQEINVSLLISPTFTYISGILKKNSEGKFIFIHTESYQNLNVLKQIKINKLIHALHIHKHEININELYDTIIITKFIFIILLKKKIRFNYLLKKQLEQQLSNNFCNDREIIKIDVLHNNNFCDDREIVKIAVSQDAYALQYASGELLADREIIIIAVSQNGNYLKLLSKDLRNDREIVEIAVSQDGYALKYASSELLADRKLIKIAVSQNGKCLELVSKYFHSDREIVRIAVSQDGYALKYASSELQADREIVEIAVINYGQSLQYASVNLREDREIVKIAVINDGLSLQYASDNLCDDREIVKIAVINNSLSLQYASTILKNDKENLKIASTKKSSRYIY